MEWLVFWIIMAVICGMVASSKGRSFFAYLLFGLILWPIALVAALLLKPLDSQRNEGGSVPPPQVRHVNRKGAARTARAEAQQLAAALRPTVFEPTGMIASLPARLDGGRLEVMGAHGLVAYPTVAAAEVTLGQSYAPFALLTGPVDQAVAGYDQNAPWDGVRYARLVGLEAPGSIYGQTRGDFVLRKVVPALPVTLSLVEGRVVASCLGQEIGEMAEGDGYVAAALRAGRAVVAWVEDVSRADDGSAAHVMLALALKSGT